MKYNSVINRVLPLFSILLMSIFGYTQSRSIANQIVIPFNVDPDAQERINEMWLRNFVDSRLNSNSSNYDPMADIVMTGLKDRDGNLWFGTNGKGLFFYDGKPGKDGRTEFQNFTTRDGLGSDDVWCSYMDRDGILWFGSKGGVTRFDGKTFKMIAIPLANGKKVNVLSIARDKLGQYWFGTEGEGVYRYDGKNFRQFLRNVAIQGSERKSPNVVSTILSDSKGNLWFGSMSRGGVYFLSTSALRNPESINQSFINHRPNASGKMVSFSPAVSKGGITDDMIMKIVEDTKGYIWIGSRDSGVFRFDGKMFVHISKSNGIPYNNVATILEDKTGNMWFGSDVKEGVNKGGISRLDKNYRTSGKIEFSELPTRKGLPGSAIRTIVEDKNGDLWFGSRGGGLIRYNGKEMTDFSFYVSRGGC